MTGAPSKPQVVTAPRVTIRHKVHGQWVADRVLNTAYYTDIELQAAILAAKKALIEKGCKSVQAHRWTPTVFNASERV